MKRNRTAVAIRSLYIRLLSTVILAAAILVGMAVFPHIAQMNVHPIGDGSLIGELWAAPASVALRVNPGCADMIQSGDFEQPNHPAWLLQGMGRFPEYRSEQTFNNSSYALRLGNGLELGNVESVSEARQVPIALPFGATSIILRFRYWPLIDGTPDAYDVQQADIFDASTEQLLDQPLLVRDNSQTWKLVDRDITTLAGRQISLRFRVRNNGLGARTLMYVDNVEIEYCPAPGGLTPTATPTAITTATTTAVAETATATSVATPTPTGTLFATTTVTEVPGWTPTPTATYVAATATTYLPTIVPTADPSCINILADPSFEGWSAWHFGEDPVPPVYIASPVHSGLRAVQLGNPPQQPTNVVTFSSIRQLVTLPYGITRAELRWQKMLRTEQEGAPNSWSDRQDLILLSPSLQPITILRREWRNEGANGLWQEDVVDITTYQGQSFYVYFNAFNDGAGGRTWMFLDDVQLNVCGGGWALPEQKYAYSTATPIAIPLTPLATSTTAPLPTPSPLPTEWLSPTATPTIFVVPTAVAATTGLAQFQAEPVVVEPGSATSIAVGAGTTTATSNVYGVPTLPSPVIIDTTTPGTVDSSSLVVTVAPPPLGATPTRGTARPLWMDRLGPIAVLSGILLLIIVIIGAIVRTFRHHQVP